MAGSLTEDFSEDVDVALGGKVNEVAYDRSKSDSFAHKIDPQKITPALKKRHDKLSKAYTGTDGAKSKSNITDYKNYYDLYDVVTPIFDLNMLVALYDQDPTHFAAIQAKVSNIVGLGYEFIESAKTTEKEDDIDDDPEKMQKFRKKLAKAKRLLTNRIDGMNEEDEFLEAIEKAVVDLETTGNGYIEVGRTQSGMVGYIGHIPSSTMRVRRRRDGFVQFTENRSTFFRRFGDRTTVDPINNDPQPNEIIHLKKYSPKDYYYGAPDIIPALRAIAGNKFADEYNLDYFENKAVPRNIIIVRGKLSENGQQKILNFFGEDLKGSHHRALFVPLPPDTKEAKHDLEVRSVEAGSQDASFKEYTANNTEKILMVHRVPGTKVGLTGDSALAAAKDLDKTFKEQVCRPLQRKIEKKINKVIGELTDVFDFKLNELDLTDENTRASIRTAMHALGATTANEIRAEDGKSGLEDGDLTIWQIQEKMATDAQQNAERMAQATNSRARDTTRATARTDSVGGARNPKGEGRTNE